MPVYLRELGTNFVKAKLGFRHCSSRLVGRLWHQDRLPNHRPKWNHRPKGNACGDIHRGKRNTIRRCLLPRPVWINSRTSIIPRENVPSLWNRLALASARPLSGPVPPMHVRISSSMVMTIIYIDPGPPVVVEPPLGATTA